MDDNRKFYSEEGSGCTSSHCNLQEINSMPLLGMRLEKTEALVSLLESRLSKAAADNVGSHRDKMKASNFPISTIVVGNWQRVSTREGDLTAKFYYAKKKVVWEFLDGPLKCKMEVSWSDITAIEAVIQPNQPGFLRIELANPPLFFREITPQPRKHTNWQQASDFTNGQAQLCRKHVVMFPPGALDKHYEKLLLNNEHLVELSRRPFPTHQSPYFNTVLPLQQTFDHPQEQQTFDHPREQQTFDHPQEQQQHPTASLLHPSLNPTVTTATINSGMVEMWGNQINNEAIFVDSLRQNLPFVLPHHEQHCEYNEIAIPFVLPHQQHYEYDEIMEIPTFHQIPTIPPNSYPAIHYGLSDVQYLMQKAASAGKQSLADAMMMQNAAASCDNHDNGTWSLLDKMMMQSDDDHRNWIDERVMQQKAVAGGVGYSWMVPHIQGSNNGNEINNNLVIYPNLRFP